MSNLVLSKIKFIERFKRQHSLRFHMSLILLATIGAGLLATRLLLALKLKNVLVRYPLAVLLVYLVFFILMKLWLKFIVPVTAARAGGGTSADALNFIPLPSGSGSSGGSSSTGGGFRGGGGGFGGGGASGSFEAVQPALAESGAEALASGVDAGGSTAAAAAGTVADAGSSLDLDDGFWVVAVLGLIAALFVGAGVYLIYEAPVILSEAAFQVILAGGLARGARQLHRGDWMGSILRATWLPLTVTLLLSVLAGYLIHHFFPGVTRLSELWARF